MTVLLAALLVFMIVCVIYLFLIMPRVIDGADTESIACDYAHRGLYGRGIPENSLAAFELAARSGAGIELDVRLTRDKRVVVFHDETLKRMCGVEKSVSELTLKELKSYRLLGTENSIPTLIEVLRLVDGRVPLLIELKGEGRDVSLCPRVARILDDYSGVFCVESFNPLLLAWFKSYRPRFARGQLVTKLTKNEKRGAFLSFALSNLLLNFISRPDFLAIDKKYQKNIAFLICTRIFKARGFVYTVCTKEEFISCHRGGKFTIFEKIRPKF